MDIAFAIAMTALLWTGVIVSFYETFHNEADKFSKKWFLVTVVLFCLAFAYSRWLAVNV